MAYIVPSEAHSSGWTWATRHRSTARLRRGVHPARPESNRHETLAGTGSTGAGPIRRRLGTTRHLLLCPDGALNLIPFGALVDDQNRYLVESYSFTYLTSGRDLLQLQVQTPSRQGPLVVANPSFDLNQIISTSDPAAQPDEGLDAQQIHTRTIRSAAEHGH